MTQCGAAKSILVMVKAKFENRLIVFQFFLLIAIVATLPFSIRANSLCIVLLVVTFFIRLFTTPVQIRILRKDKILVTVFSGLFVVYLIDFIVHGFGSSFLLEKKF